MDKIYTKEEIKKDTEMIVEYGWGSFPDYKSAVKSNGDPLWPEEFSPKILADRHEVMGEVAWAQEMLNQPIPDHDLFTRDDFVACFDITQLGQRVGFYSEMAEDMPVYAGADLAIARTLTSGFAAITTILVREDGRLQIIDGFRGKPGPELITTVFVERYNRLHWQLCQVENNNVQGYIIYALGQRNLPVIPFNTGSNKVDILSGVPYLASLVKMKRLILPTGTVESKKFTDTLIEEALVFGQGHSGDVLMSTWLAVNLIKKVKPAGMDTSYLPDPGEHGFVTDDQRKKISEIADIMGYNIDGPVVNMPNGDFDVGGFPTHGNF